MSRLIWYRFWYCKKFQNFAQRISTSFLIYFTNHKKTSSLFLKAVYSVFATVTNCECQHFSITALCNNRRFDICFYILVIMKWWCLSQLKCQRSFMFNLIYMELEIFSEKYRGYNFTGWLSNMLWTPFVNGMWKWDG